MYVCFNSIIISARRYWVLVFLTNILIKYRWLSHIWGNSECNWLLQHDLSCQKLGLHYIVIAHSCAVVMDRTSIKPLLWTSVKTGWSWNVLESFLLQIRARSRLNSYNRLSASSVQWFYHSKRCYLCILTHFRVECTVSKVQGCSYIGCLFLCQCISVPFLNAKCYRHGFYR